MKQALLTLIIFALTALPALSKEINLAWNGGSGATGYKIYYSSYSPDDLMSDPGSPVDVGSDTELTLDLPGDVYYLAATSYNATGAESTFSNIVCTSWMPTNSAAFLRNTLDRCSTM